MPARSRLQRGLSRLPASVEDRLDQVVPTDIKAGFPELVGEEALGNLGKSLAVGGTAALSMVAPGVASLIGAPLGAALGLKSFHDFVKPKGGAARLKDKPLRKISGEDILGLPIGMFGTRGGSPSTAGLTTFAGTRAKGANIDRLKVAKRALTAGEPVEKIRQKTGWDWDPTAKRWRFEIDDSKMNMNQKLFDKGFVPLSKLVTHKEWLKNYPAAKKFKVRVNINPARREGVAVFDPQKGEISMTVPNKQAARSVGTHEFQHLTNFLEGVAGNVRAPMGGQITTRTYDKILNTDKPILNTAIKQLRAENAKLAPSLKHTSTFNPDVLKKVQANNSQILDLEKQLNRGYFDINSPDMKRALQDRSYQALRGEREADASAARLDLTAAERQALPPAASEGFGPGNKTFIPVRDQIMREQAAKLVGPGGVGFGAPPAPSPISLGSGGFGRLLGKRRP